MKFLTRLNIVALLISKDKSNRENKLYLNEGTILCLLYKLNLPASAGPDTARGETIKLTLASKVVFRL